MNKFCILTFTEIRLESQAELSELYIDKITQRQFQKYAGFSNANGYRKFEIVLENFSSTQLAFEID